MRWPLNQELFDAIGEIAVNAAIGAALSNALVAAAMAVSAFVVTRFARRPALAHALWLLVLLKLLTPPLWAVPVAWKAPPPPAEPIVRSPLTDGVPLSEALIAPSPSFSTEFLPIDPVEPAPIETALLSPLSPSPVAPPSSPSLSLSVILTRIAIAAWGIGSVACAAVIALRLRRFSWLLRHGCEAPDELSEEVASLSVRVGIRNPPRTLLLPGAVCPMLFATPFSATLILPRDLWAQLDPSQRRTLLLHELAHLRRRDYWVRLVEIAATVLYWWHPVTWIARRAMRDAEEQCCDAWVVWAAPRSARDYSAALLEAVDFVSSARPFVPALASGMGEFHSLKRRLTMIKRGNTPRGLGWAGFSAFCALAAVTLPLRPTLAEEEPIAPAGVPEVAPVINEIHFRSVEPAAPVLSVPEAVPPTEPVGVPVLKHLPVVGRIFVNTQSPLAAPAPAVPGAEHFAEPDPNLAAFDQEMHRSEQQLQRAHAELQRAQAALQESQARHQALMMQRHGRGVGVPHDPGVAQPMPRATSVRPARRVGPAVAAVPADPALPGQPPRAESAPRPGAMAPAGGMGAAGIPGNGGGGFGRGPARTTPPGRDDQDRRIASLEEKLDTLVNELRAIRQEIKDRPESPTPTGVRR